MPFLKDDPWLAKAALEPARPVEPAARGAARAIAATYNRVGGLLAAAARAADLPLSALLAIWQVESGGAAFTPGRAILRFEAHKFFESWAKNKKQKTIYDAHFRHGGRADIPGRPWENHACRRPPAAFAPFHGSQTSEYAALALAVDLAGEEAAYRAASIGGPQLLMSGHAALGYRDARAMFRAFQASERAHVLGLMDYCANHGLFPALRQKDWRGIAKAYNGSGAVDIYAPRLKAAQAAAAALGLDGEEQ